MRKILKTIGLSLVFASAVLASAIVASAQEARSFEVGQAVEIFCNCFGDNAWTKGRIESIDDNGCVVRYGDGRFHTKIIKFGSDRMRDPNQPAAPSKPANLSNDRQVSSGGGGSANDQTADDQRKETTFKAGDTVELQCGNCPNNRNGWVRAKIVKIDYGRTDDGEYVLDTGEKNHRGEPKYYSQFVGTGGLRSLDEERSGQVREQFLKEANSYLKTFEQFDPNGSFQKAGNLPREDAAKYKADFQAVAALCQKYGKVTNPPGEYAERSITYRPADLCEMSKQGDAMAAKARAAGLAEELASAQRMALGDLENAFDTPNGMREETQRIIFDRAAWEREERAKLAKGFPATPEEALKKYFAEIFAKADEVKARIEREAPDKSWDAPVLRNAALEGMVKSYYAKYRPGVTVVKIGMYQTDYKTFNNSLGIPTTQVISGAALVKVAGRPLCQSQIFELNKEYLGGGRFSAVKPLYIGREGTFVKCQ